jgi:hypothetical protein
MYQVGGISMTGFRSVVTACLPELAILPRFIHVGGKGAKGDILLLYASVNASKIQSAQDRPPSGSEIRSIARVFEVGHTDQSRHKGRCRCTPWASRSQESVIPSKRPTTLRTSIWIMQNERSQKLSVLVMVAPFCARSWARGRFAYSRTTAVIRHIAQYVSHHLRSRFTISSCEDLQSRAKR